MSDIKYLTKILKAVTGEKSDDKFKMELISLIFAKHSEEVLSVLSEHLPENDWKNIQLLKSGTFSSCFALNDDVVMKLGTMRQSTTAESIKHFRILPMFSRNNLRDEKGRTEAYIDFQPRIITDRKNFVIDDLNDVYDDLAKAGISWGDAGMANLGLLSEKRLKSMQEYYKNISESFRKKPVVIVDDGFIKKY